MKKPVGKKRKTLFISDSEEEASAPQERPRPKTANPFTAGPTKSPYLSTPPRQDKKLKRMTSTVNTDTLEQQHATTLSGPAPGALVPVQNADGTILSSLSLRPDSSVRKSRSGRLIGPVARGPVVLTQPRPTHHSSPL